MGGVYLFLGCCKVTGRRHRVSPCRSAHFASPWWLLTLDLVDVVEKQLYYSQSRDGIYLTMRLSPPLFMIIPNTKRHLNNTKTDQLPMFGVITGLPRPHHNTGDLMRTISRDRKRIRRWRRCRPLRHTPRSTHTEFERRPLDAPPGLAHRLLVSIISVRDEMISAWTFSTKTKRIPKIPTPARVLRAQQQIAAKFGTRMCPCLLYTSPSPRDS